MSKNKRNKRQDTKLESVGAEFLVLGHLLTEKIAAHKTYTNYPGYDLTAVNPNAVINKKNKVARIQVKSRWATDCDKSFTLKNVGCDFVVFVLLNRGIWFRKRKKGTEIKPPEFYVLPIQKLKPKGSWKRIKLSDIKNHLQYKDNWQLIKEYLK